MHLPGDEQRNAHTTIQSRVDWYFEAATLAHDLAVSAAMRERNCTREEAVMWLDGVWRKRWERKYDGR